MYDEIDYGGYSYLSQKPKATYFLIILNIVGFVLSGILPYLFGFRDYDQIISLSKGTSIEKLWLWQFLTYGFSYFTGGFAVIFLILFMGMLYLFGRELELIIGSKKLLAVYFGCHVVGGFCHVVYQYLSGTSVPADGNQYAGTMAVISISSFMWPNRPIFFFFLIPMRMITACLIVIGIQVFYSILNLQSGTASIAALGACAASFVWFKTGPIFDAFVAKMENASVRRKILIEERLRREVDRILEKISKEGRSSLTKKEEETLKKASKLFAKRQ